VKTPTPNRLLLLSIKYAHQAIKRHTTYAANLRTSADETRAKNFKDVQDQLPTVKLIEVTSSNELLRTTERSSLFDGPWLQGSSPHEPPAAYTQVWKRKGGTMKQIGRAMADTTGMLDTARHIVWAEISTQTPPSEKHDEIALLRNARLWHEFTRPIENINHNPGTKAQTPNKQHCPDNHPPTISNFTDLATDQPTPTTSRIMPTRRNVFTRNTHSKTGQRKSHAGRF
jgi:hypothetical protein